MGYTVIQVQFLMDREQITALYCINKDQPELQCQGKCELGKRLNEAKNHQDNSTDITLEELHLTFLKEKREVWTSQFAVLNFNITNTPTTKNSKLFDLEIDFFHPPQS
ncbi:hypothetical protein GCM10027164_33940 [Algoriphagus taiwanensis]